MACTKRPETQRGWLFQFQVDLPHQRWNLAGTRGLVPEISIFDQSEHFGSFAIKRCERRISGDDEGIPKAQENAVNFRVKRDL
jgi:hypothetical protein